MPQTDVRVFSSGCDELAEPGEVLVMEDWCGRRERAKRLLQLGVTREQCRGAGGNNSGRSRLPGRRKRVSAGASGGRSAT